MKVSFQDGRMLLPLSNSCCPDETNNSCPAAKGCFITGIDIMNYILQVILLRRYELRYVRKRYA